MRAARRSSAVIVTLVIASVLAFVAALRWVGASDPTRSVLAGSGASPGEPNFDIYSVDVASGVDRRLTDDPRKDVDPEWSPDGSQIAFARFSGEDLHDLYLMDADGSNERVLVGGGTDDIGPTWSPDGKQIAFMSDRSSFGDLFIVDVESGEILVKRIARSPLGAQFPAWSPAGDEIALVADYPVAGETRIFTVASDGSDKDVVRVLDGCCRRLIHIEWSADARWLALTWQPEEQADVWRMRADGHGALRRITDGIAGDGYATWSPVGAGIAFQSNRHAPNGDDLYVIDVDGSGERALFRTPWVDENPDWSPDGGSIAFDSIRGADI